MKKSLKTIITLLITTAVIIVPFAAEGLAEIPGVLEFAIGLYKYMAIAAALFAVFFIAFCYKKSKAKAKKKTKKKALSDDHSFYKECKNQQRFQNLLREISFGGENHKKEQEESPLTVKVREAFPGASEMEIIQAYAAAQKGLIKI